MLLVHLHMVLFCFILGLPRPRKRLTELIVKSSEQNVEDPKGKHWTLKFLRSPVGVRELDGGRLSVKFEVNRVEGEKAVGTGVFEEIECDVVFRSVGYRGVKVFDELPFDEVGGVVVNQGGRVKEGEYLFLTFIEFKCSCVKPILFHFQESTALDGQDKDPVALSYRRCNTLLTLQSWLLGILRMGLLVGR